MIVNVTDYISRLVALGQQRWFTARIEGEVSITAPHKLLCGWKEISVGLLQDLTLLVMLWTPQTFDNIWQRGFYEWQ